MENMNLSDKSKEALKSGIWKELGNALKAEIVKEYLQTGYADEIKQLDIEVSGTTYKVLNRGETTVFYDALGNTLFSVGNAELVAEYEKLGKDGDSPDPADGKGDTVDIAGEESAAPSETEKSEAEDFKEKACEKLRGEKEKAEDKQFADPVIGYLLKRCGEDNSLAQDVMQEHKTWKKCFEYIFEQARKQAKGNSAAVRDDVVYEWAEDYYHKNDKAEEEKKVREAAERKKKEAERKKKAAEKKPLASQEAGTYAKREKAADKPAEPKPKKNSKDMDGQMDLFSMMGV